MAGHGLPRDTRSFYTSDVNEILLAMDKEMHKTLDAHSRNSVYAHLAHFLPRGQRNIMRQAKKLSQAEEPDKLEVPLQNLAQAINETIPEQTMRYDAECQAALRDHKERQEKEKDALPDIIDITTEDTVVRQQGAENTKRFNAPNKKFEWTDHLRTLLCTVVRTKMEMYSSNKGKHSSVKEYLETFLEQEVKSLWPPGWMNTRMLMIHSRAVHYRWTSY